MIKGLIRLFEKLKENKLAKFSSPNSDSLLERWGIIKQLLEEYKTNIFALCKLAPYLEYNNKRPGYLSLVANMLNVLGDNIDFEDEQKIRNDANIIAIIAKTEEKADKVFQYNQKYEHVQEEIAVIDHILSELKSLKEDDYIERDLINEIYNYLRQEVYISYQEKFVSIGQLIASHNIEVANKRTLI